MKIPIDRNSLSLVGICEISLRLSQLVISILLVVSRRVYLISLVGGFSGIFPKLNFSAKYMLFSSSVN